MDWLVKYQAQINCPKQRITLRGPNREKIVPKGMISKSGVKLITAIKAHKLLGRGCEGSLYNVVETEVAEPFLQNIPVIREFLDVFSNVFTGEIPGMPPLREVEFCIDLIPRATPIFKAPYRMAPAELKELKKHLVKLLEKGLSD